MTGSELKNKLTTRNLAIVGVILILVGNLFSYTVLNVRVHELIANVGALILVVGTLQWFFDEESRQSLIDRISNNIESYLVNRDNITRLGPTEFTMDSKSIVSNPSARELIDAHNLVFGIHYSDGIIVRFEAIIRERMQQGKLTQVLHSSSEGIAKSYLEECLPVNVNLLEKINRLKHLVETRFANSEQVRMIEHTRVLRYSFIISDRSIWLTFLTNSENYQPTLPAIRISANTPLYDFFKQDAVVLGALL